jgi:hypothetical protein
MARYRISFLLAAALLLALVACGGGSGARTSGSSATTSPSSASSTSTSSTSTSGTKSTSTRTSATPSANGRPFVGGPYSDFVKKYGQPNSIGANGRALFRASSAPQILIGVSPTSGAVKYTGADGPATWTTQDAFAYCAQFLPNGATQYHSDGQHKYYHSGVGDLHLDAPSTGAGTSGTGAGTCGLTLSNVT